MSKARQIRWLGAVIAVAFCVALAYSSLASGKETEETVEPRAEVLATLPCFGCHSLQRYMAPPAPGVFSHDLHSMFDLHCNACHEIAGHKMPKLKVEVCGTCHSMKAFEYVGGGMGKVRFNHEAHGAMFSCSKCHPDVFYMKKGGSKINMNAMYEGKSCGSCHNGKMAFASQDCMRCHRMGK